MIDLENILSQLDDLHSDVSATKSSLIDGGAALNEYNLNVQRVKSQIESKPSSSAENAKMLEIENAVKKSVAEVALPIDPEIQGHLDAINHLLYEGDAESDEIGDAEGKETKASSLLSNGMSDTEKELAERMLGGEVIGDGGDTKVHEASANSGRSPKPSTQAVEDLLSGIRRLEVALSRDEVELEMKRGREVESEVAEVETSFELRPSPAEPSSSQCTMASLMPCRKASPRGWPSSS